MCTEPYVVDENNIDEFYYKNFGTTHRSFYWRWAMKTKWFFQELKFKFPKRNKVVREFLHLDIQRLKYNVKQFSFSTFTLRYVDKNGNIFSRKFKVWVGYSYIELMEIPGTHPVPAKGPKGPRTCKIGERVGSKYRWFGIKRYHTWKLRLGYIY